ncbi:hypothetical protein DNTS_006492 [Danionella cerebrum]|uniref:Uncharacterized protein n=1 Tax=Danionella cerebrum TaxID=2873325 RepID=A0A553QK61_9TELE|nr:hypothetical protein DNTS_006492 [Danionella translucida]
MAVSLLRLGRFGSVKCLLRGSWGTARPCVAALCSAAEVPPKASKKPKGSKKSAEPVPEPEPFDNTSYKNLQHHQYNLYTFSDMDVEMSKYRLPQPSSGRISPRH